jgi:ferritin-like metal-binding protein YciE
MSFLESIQRGVESDPQLQGLVEKVEQAASLVLLILTALQLGRAIAVKVVEEILTERGQAPVKRQLDLLMATIRNAHGGWLKDTHF